MNDNCCGSKGNTLPLSIVLFLLAPPRKYSLLPEYCASSPFGSLDNLGAIRIEPPQNGEALSTENSAHFLVHKFKGMPDDSTSSSLMKLWSKQL